MQDASGPMLFALDLARRIEAGELTPAAVIDRCAQAIKAHENAVGAFVVLDLERAHRTAERKPPYLPPSRFADFQSASKIFSIRSISQLNMVRRSMPGIGPPPTPRSSLTFVGLVALCSERLSRPSSRSRSKSHS